MRERKSSSETAKPSVQGVLKTVLRVLVIVAALLVALLIVLKYDSLTPEALRDAVAPQQQPLQSGYSERLTFAANSNNTYAAYMGGLAVLSPSGIELQSGTGEQLLAISKNFASPALEQAGGYLAAYDIGGTAFLLLGNGVELYNISYASSIISADVSPTGLCAVAAEESGMRGAVTVFTPEGTNRYKYFSSERFIVDCALSDESEKLAVAGVRQEDAKIISSVILMSLSSETPFATWETSGELVVGVEFLGNDGVLVMTEQRLVFLDEEGTYLGEYDYRDSGLAAFAEGDDFVVVCPNSSVSAESSHVSILSQNGAVEQELLVGGLVGICAQGDEFSILTNDAVLVYNRQLERIAQSALVSDCRSVLMGDGAVITVASDAADIYTYG